MFEVSDTFKELMKSNVRPKCEPTITVRGVENADGTTSDLIWKPKNIKEMSFKRGIDPVGRNLPFMEIRWTEIYNGKLNADLIPQIYKNVVAFLPVELKIEQSLGFFNTWKIILENGLTWKNISENFTWKSLKKDAPKQEVIYPTLFLSGKPTVNGNIVEWTAYDLLHYLDTEETVSYYPQGEYIGKRFNCIQNIILNSRSAYLSSPSIIESITKTVSNFEESEEHIAAETIFDGATNSLMKDYASLLCRYWDFKEDYAKMNFFYNFNDPESVPWIDTGFYIPLRLQYSNPKITKNSNISSYEFKKYSVEVDYDNTTTKYPSSFNGPYKIENNDNDYYILNYLFDGYGETDESINGERGVSYSINRAYSIIDIPSGSELDTKEYPIIVRKKILTEINSVINTGYLGQAFVENNKLNSIGNEDFNEKRLFALNKYFNTRCDSAELNCAPNISLETGDVIRYETAFYDDNGDRIQKDAVIVELELKYSGSFRQKIKVHEVEL